MANREQTNGLRIKVLSVDRPHRPHADDDGGNDYAVDHSTFIYLMGPDGSYRTHFSHSAQADEIAEGLARHIGG